MPRKCGKCGYILQENDFLCPQCGAIYGEPVYETPKEEKTRFLVKLRRNLGYVGILLGVILLSAFLGLCIWDMSQPETTVPSDSLSTTLAPETLTAAPTTRPSDQKQLNWTMAARVVHLDGRPISRETITIHGNITRNTEITDTIELEIIFPPDFRYRFATDGYQEYRDTSNGLLGSYYVCTITVYDRIENGPAFITFALDPEAECAVFVLPGEPTQFLICSTSVEVNVEDAMYHFQTFLKTYIPAT